MRTNKFIGLMLVLVMLLTAVLPTFGALAEGAAEVTFVTSATEALKPGDTFTVTPTIANNPGFAGVTWKLDYDNTALELVSISNEDEEGEITYLLEAGTFISNKAYAEAGSDVNNIVFARAELLKKKAGSLCVLTFRVREKAAAGDYTVNVRSNDADFKFVALDSVNVDVNFTPCTVTVANDGPDYSNAYLAYCKGSKNAYEFIPVGDTIYINNADGNGNGSIQEYRIAVVNDDEIVSEVSADKWTVENKDNVFMNAYHNSADPDGVFYINAHGKQEGASGTITATLPDNSELKCNVVVTATPYQLTVTGTEGLDGSQYNNQTAFAVIGDEFKFKYVLKDPGGSAINPVPANVQYRFESSDASVATVAEDGTVTAVADGNAEITVYAVGYAYGEEILVPLKSQLKLCVDSNYIKYLALVDEEGNVRTSTSKNSANYTISTLDMTAGEELVLYAKGMPGMTDPVYSGKEKTFSCTSGSGLTVTNNADGSITLKADDVTADTTATIRSSAFYRSGANKKANSTTSVSVNIKAPAPVESVTLNKDKLELQEEETEKLTATVLPGNAKQSVTWASDNDSVALVSPDGTVTAVAVGTANITATSTADTTKTATCEVTVTAVPEAKGLTALLGCGQKEVVVGDEVEVKLYVDSDDAEKTYNAFEFNVNFSDNLEYLGFDGLDTENDYNYVDVNGTDVKVSGFGKNKTASRESELISLSFKAKAAGEAMVTLSEDAAYANGRNVAVNDDLQTINVLNNRVVLNVLKSFEIPITGGTVNNGETGIAAIEGKPVSFTPDAPAADRKIDEVKVNGEKIEPNADGSYTIASPDENTTIEIVTSMKTYTVTFEGSGKVDADGNASVTHGNDYTFTIMKDSDYNYGVTATIGGTNVAVTGEYKIAGKDVTGNITIVITKTEKSEEETMRSVTAYLNDADAKEMTKVAKNAPSYTFSNPYDQNAKPYKATVNGMEVAITADNNGTWLISGTFAGSVEIFFGGVYDVRVPDGVTGETTAEYQKDYSFTVPAGYEDGKPTVTISGEEYALAEGTEGADGSVTYVIPGADIKGDIIIILPVPTAKVDVNLYFKAEDQFGAAYNVYLVTAKPGAVMPSDKVYAYDGNQMFWSEEYQAFAYLVSINESFNAEAATAHVGPADGDKEQKKVDYSGDVNKSGRTDLNDAQLVYDLYNANYHDFSVVSMEKMLRADMNKNKEIGVDDVTAIVSIVRK